MTQLPETRPLPLTKAERDEIYAAASEAVALLGLVAGPQVLKASRMALRYEATIAALEAKNQTLTEVADALEIQLESRPSSGSAPERDLQERIAVIRYRMENAGTMATRRDGVEALTDQQRDDLRFLLDELSRRAVPGEDSARLDWLEARASEPGRTFRWLVHGLTVHCCYEDNEIGPLSTKFARIFAEKSQPTLRAAIDAARSTPSEQESK